MVTRRFIGWLAVPLSAVAAAAPLENLPQAALEQRVHEIDGQLAQLANYNLRGGVGAIGSRSNGYDTAEQDEWIEVELGDAVPLDQIVLVPAIRRDVVNGFQADGFPVAFRLRVGVNGDRVGKIVGEFTERDGLLPRIAPMVIPCHGIKASWLRIEATILSRREFDAKFVFQFSEILAFSGEENVALHKLVRYSGSRERGIPG